MSAEQVAEFVRKLEYKLIPLGPSSGKPNDILALRRFREINRRVRFIGRLDTNSPTWLRYEMAEEMFRHIRKQYSDVFGTRNDVVFIGLPIAGLDMNSH